MDKLSAKHVRCVVYGQRGDREFAEVLSFLRGFSVLYGSGLALQSEPCSSADEVDAQVTRELTQGGGQLMHVNARRSVASPSLPNQAATKELRELFARITVERSAEQEQLASDVPLPTQTQEFIVFGKAALTHWMKQYLLEARYVAVPQTTESADHTSEGAPLRMFVSGDRAQVGKSTVCLGLVGSLLRSGYAASDIAYIKPATQCEKPQLVAKYCRQQGISCCDVGPILFYKGFTREFLKGSTESSAQLLARAKAKVDEVGRGKKVVVVDGVGYPAVGSICGVSNASVAKAVQAPVVLVGKKGVGDAVDSFNLNASFFESHGVKVLGGIFNRLPADGFYSLEHCRENVTAYFEHFQPDKRVYGFLPELADGGLTALHAEKSGEGDGEEHVPESEVFLTAAEDQLATKVVDAFMGSIDMTHLLADAKASQTSSEKKVTEGKQATSTGGKAKAQSTGGKAKRPRPKFEIPTSTELCSL
ncbi:hypothetical protein BBJ28_00008002 [Nothophytophthora sp. Chile5]|nr:hypothetical protein BBJ28_00008002 [Nothophytophthora sp. Chile5]